MGNSLGTNLVIETEPKPEDVRLLKDRIYKFNAQATGIADGKLFAVLLSDDNGATIGGIYCWTWGATCYVRYLYVPAHLRTQGHGSGLMGTVEVTARERGCAQIVLETHEFQAPEFYRRLGFEVTGCVEGYPHGHQCLTMVKLLT